MFVRPNGIKIECGPTKNRQTFKLQLPLQKKVAVLVSGGIDSALLYWALTYLNSTVGWTHSIMPYTVHRREGSPVYAPRVTEYVNSYFGISNVITVVGNNNLAESAQVQSGIKEIFDKRLAHVVYTGNIKVLDIHAIGWDVPRIVDLPTVRSPMLNMDKSHVTDSVIQLGQQQLFKITRSCNSFSEVTVTESLLSCGVCNGCNERRWGFQQLGLTQSEYE